MTPCNYNGPKVKNLSKLQLPPEWNTAIPPPATKIKTEKFGNGITYATPVWNEDWLKGLESYVRSILRDELNTIQNKNIINKESHSVHPLVGCFFRHMGITYRVMAVVENYAMIRAKGCSPFCVYIKDLESDYFKIETINDTQPQVNER